MRTLYYLSEWFYVLDQSLTTLDSTELVKE